MEYDRALYRVYERILEDLSASEPILQDYQPTGRPAAAGGPTGAAAGPSLPYFLPLQCAGCVDTIVEIVSSDRSGAGGGIGMVSRRSILLALRRAYYALRARIHLYAAVGGGSHISASNIGSGSSSVLHSSDVDEEMGVEMATVGRSSTAAGSHYSSGGLRRRGRAASDVIAEGPSTSASSSSGSGTSQGTGYTDNDFGNEEEGGDGSSTSYSEDDDEDEIEEQERVQLVPIPSSASSPARRRRRTPSPSAAASASNRDPTAAYFPNPNISATNTNAETRRPQQQQRRRGRREVHRRRSQRRRRRGGGGQEGTTTAASTTRPRPTRPARPTTRTQPPGGRRVARDEAGLICTQKGLYAASRTASLLGWISLAVLYCLHSTYVGAGVVRHSGVFNFVDNLGRILGGGSSNMHNSNMKTCIEYALATRLAEDRRSEFFDLYGDEESDDDDDSTDGNEENSKQKTSKKDKKRQLRGSVNHSGERTGYYMSAVDTGEKGTLDGERGWLWRRFMLQREEGSSAATASQKSNSTTKNETAVVVADPPLLGRDEVLQIKILYGGECTGQCSRVRHVVYPSTNREGNSSASINNLTEVGDDDGDPLLTASDNGLVEKSATHHHSTDNSTWLRRGMFVNSELPSKQGAIDKLSSASYWKQPHYRFATDDALLYLDKRSLFLHNVSIVNITLTERCLSTGNDHGSATFLTRVAEFMAQVFGMDSVIVNQLMYGIRTNDNKYRNGHLVNVGSKEHWTWRKTQLESYDDDNIGSWFVRKLGIVSISILTFFLLTSVTAVIVRVLTSSGVVLMFPIFTLFRALGVPGADERILGLSYPWIGRARMAIGRRRIHSTAHLIAAHSAKIFLYYLMYEACQAAWSAVLYGKSIPEGLPIWLFGFAMVWEYFTMVFVRSALSVYFFPRCLMLYFVLYHLYFLSTPYAWFDVALVPWFLFMVQAMFYTIIALEIPAVARGAITLECPREVYNRLSWAEWTASLPHEWTLFLPLNSRHTPLYDREMSDIVDEENGAGAGAAGEIEDGDRGTNAGDQRQEI